MSLATIIVAESEHHAPMIMDPWVFGVIALVGFAVLGIVAFTFRDVANRHPHKAAPGATAHAGSPGATTHGSGHPGGHGH